MGQDRQLAIKVNQVGCRLEKAALVEDRRARFKAGRGVENTGPLGQIIPHIEKSQYPEKLHGREIAPSSEARLDICL